MVLVLVAGMANAQLPNTRGSVPEEAGGCKVIDGKFGPLQCPNGSSCGTYYTLQTEECNLDNEPYCETLLPISVCCGRYGNYQDSGANCSLAKMKDPAVRSRLVELAKSNEILVPTCSGAYVPARIAFQQHKRIDDGGL
jgi:hypothetical protein